MTQEEFLGRVADCLAAAAIPFMIAGSLCSSHHGRPRATNDVDLIVDPSPEQLNRFLALLGDTFYVSLSAAQDALRGRSMFNIIDLSDGWKADLIIRKQRPYSVEEFQRRKTETLFGRTLPLASPEDAILTKLEWDKITPSDRQRQDALNVAVVQWPKLDQAYLRRWAGPLGVADTLEELLGKAKDLCSEPPPGC
jgi:hypothetical protein